MTMFMNRVQRGSLRSVRLASPRHSWWTTAGTVIDDIVTTLLDWRERARQRRQLLSLDGAALKDFGRSRADAAGEGDKPFWRA